MNPKRIAIATTIGLLCGLYCAYATSQMENPATGAPYGVFILLSIVYNRALIGFVIGIAIGKLHREGLLMETHGFLKWTKELPDSKLHGQPCKNLEDALKGAESAGKRSSLSPIVKWCEIEPLRNLRNKLMHGQMLEISEHETANIMILLHAVFHHVEPNQST